MQLNIYLSVWLAFGLWKVVYSQNVMRVHLIHNCCVRRGGVEVAGWILDRKIRVRFPAYPHRVWTLWWQGGKRRLRTSRCPCRGRLGTLKTPSCPWRRVPGSRSKFGNWTSLSRHYIDEISLNVKLNHNQQQQHNCCGSMNVWPVFRLWLLSIQSAA